MDRPLAVKGSRACHRVSIVPVGSPPDGATAIQRLKDVNAMIFVRFFGWSPDGLEDKRWDTLLHELKGMRLLHQLLGRPRYW